MSFGKEKSTINPGLSIRPVRDADVAFSAQLNASENWTDTLLDIRRLVRCEPNGFMIAELQGRPVGQILSIGYGKLGWIGYLIVDKEHRGKGIGRVLMQEAIAYLNKSNVETIYLEANPRAVDFYQKIGFHPELKTWKFTRLNQHIGTPDLTTVEPMINRDLDEVAVFDERFFSANRSKVLETILIDNPGLCYVAREKSELQGYVMSRPTRTGFRIGPLVCDPSTPQTAEALLTATSTAIPVGAKAFLSSPEINSAYLDILSRYGFERLSPNMRMALGRKQELTPIRGIFSLGGLEKG